MSTYSVTTNVSQKIGYTFRERRLPCALIIYTENSERYQFRFEVIELTRGSVYPDEQEFPNFIRERRYKYLINDGSSLTPFLIQTFSRRQSD